MRRYLTVAQAAEYLGVSKEALYMRIHRRTIEYVKWGRGVRLDQRKLDAMMDEATQEVLGA